MSQPPERWPSAAEMRAWLLHQPDPGDPFAAEIQAWLREGQPDRRIPREGWSRFDVEQAVASWRDVVRLPGPPPAFAPRAISWEIVTTFPVPYERVRIEWVLEARSRRRLQAKDLPDEDVIAAIQATRGRNGVPEWATTWDVVEHLKAWPPKVVLTKLRSCIRRGVIGGHACSKVPPYCRGDFEIPAL